MEFKEKNENLIFFSMNQLPECFVYFLLDGKEVVYVGQTKSGLSRPLSHKNKVFDRIAILKCNEQELDDLENKFILKYSPRYNKMINRGNCSSFNMIKANLRKRYGLRFQVKDVINLCDFFGIEPFNAYGTNYINNTDLEKFHYFIFKTNHLLRRLGDNSTAAVFRKKLTSILKKRS